MYVNKLPILINEGFAVCYQKYVNSDLFCLELYCIEHHLIFNSYQRNTKNSIFLGSSMGKIDIFESLFKISSSFKKSYIDDSEESVYLTSISSTNANNNSFFGEILVKLCKSIPDGIICYFSSISIMEYYIKKWDEQGVFDNIMNEKLLFIEEQESVRLTQILTNYKKACDVGRGGLLFLSTRNKASLKDNLRDHYSRCIIFIGFPIETKLTKKFELKMGNVKKEFGLDNKEYFNYDTFKLFATKVAEKITDIFDKKVLVVLDEKLMSEKLKDYLPEWLKKIMHTDYDKDNINTDERLKLIKLFLANNKLM
jgi:Rad3-related DNA helicase